MFKGFYNLTSGMLTQGRSLDLIANNMTNVATAGYKADTMTATTFRDVLWSRVGNKSKYYTDLGRQSYLLVPGAVDTDFSPGAFDETGLPLDFALEGDGFFAVDTAAGRAYTRGGSFTLDGEGYLCLPGQGRVLNPEGAPILLVTDHVTADGSGNLFTLDGGYLGTLGVFSFAGGAQPEKNPQGLFVSGAAAEAGSAQVRQGMLEHSNVDLIREMVAMISCQRAYQSAAQVTKMYDQLISKAVSDVGRL